MISADTGGSAYVVGSSIAIVATGPMPGSTPISVPSSVPISAYIRLIGVSATRSRGQGGLGVPCVGHRSNTGQIGSCRWRPTTKTPTASADRSTPAMSGLLADGTRGWPRWPRRSGARSRSRRRPCATMRPNSTTLPSTTSVGRHFHAGTRSPELRMPRSAMIVPRSDQQDAEDAREVAGAHPRRGAERVARADDERPDAERDEQHAGPEVLRTAGSTSHVE